MGGGNSKKFEIEITKKSIKITKTFVGTIVSYSLSHYKNMKFIKRTRPILIAGNE